MFFFISSGAPLFRVLMVELVDTLDLDSSAREGVRVRLSVGALGICKLPYCSGAGFIKAGALTAQSKVGRKKLKNDT